MIGPAAWAAVGRALLVAIARGTLFGGNGLVRLVAQQISTAILEEDYAVAEAMLRDMRRNHRAEYDEFLRKFKDELPAEFLAGLGRT